MLFFFFLNGKKTFALDEKLLNQLENYLNQFNNISSQFIQSSSAGSQETGKILLSKPGKLRIEYKNNNKLIISIIIGTIPLIFMYLFFHDSIKNIYDSPDLSFNVASRCILITSFVLLITKFINFDIKKSLTRENLSEFLNMVKTLYHLEIFHQGNHFSNLHF